MLHNWGRYTRQNSPRELSILLCISQLSQLTGRDRRTIAKLRRSSATAGSSYGEIAFITRKTGRRIVLPLVQPLSDYLASLRASDNPDAFIFPRAASANRTGTLSNQFRDILVSASLVEPRGHEARGKRPLTSARNERNFVSQPAPQRGNDAESLWRFRCTSARNCGTRKRRSLSPLHAMQRLPDVTNAIQRH